MLLYNILICRSVIKYDALSKKEINKLKKSPLSKVGGNKTMDKYIKKTIVVSALVGVGYSVFCHTGASLEVALGCGLLAGVTMFIIACAVSPFADW